MVSGEKQILSKITELTAAEGSEPIELKSITDYLESVKEQYRDMQDDPATVEMSDTVGLSSEYLLKAAQAGEHSKVAFKLGMKCVKRVAMKHLLQAVKVQAQMGVQASVENCVSLFTERFVGNDKYLKYIIERQLPLLRNAIRLLNIVK
jgi:hypothetical protein